MKLGQQESHPAPGSRSQDLAALGACVIITCQDGRKPGDPAAVAWAGGSLFLRVNFCCGTAGSRVRKPPLVAACPPHPGTAQHAGKQAVQGRAPGRSSPGVPAQAKLTRPWPRGCPGSEIRGRLQLTRFPRKRITNPDASFTSSAGVRPTTLLSWDGAPFSLTVGGVGA